MFQVPLQQELQDTAILAFPSKTYFPASSRKKHCEHLEGGNLYFQSVEMKN